MSRGYWGQEVRGGDRGFYVGGTGAEDRGFHQVPYSDTYENITFQQLRRRAVMMSH